MNITNVLLVIILFILVKQFYPDTAETLVAVGIVAFTVYSGYWLITQFPARLKARRAQRRQEEQDEREHSEYQKKHDAIRTKYDPQNAWNEATSVPNEYVEEIRTLNSEHRGMLQRRSGWTTDDFNE